MKQGKSAQIKKIKHINQKQHKKQHEEKLPPFNYDEFAGFLRARYYLTHHDKYSRETFEVASFFLDDVIAMMVNQNFSAFTSNERATVNLSEVMQATLVNSDDKDWRYFVMLVPVLYDMQKFIIKESSVNPRFVAQAPKFDINFWRMIMRTVMAINFFKWQGKDVAEMMKTSQAIDTLQFKFLSENEADDDFNLAVIHETFKGLSPVLRSLKNAEFEESTISITDSVLETELAYAKIKLGQFKLASVKDVVSDNVTAMLYAFHEGMAKEYGLTHDSWSAEALKAFTVHHLLDYWRPEWQDLDGIGGELKSYLTFLSSKQAITGLKDKIDNLDYVDRYIDVSALNYLLADMSIDDTATRA